jgi:HlyD family secretion protein
LTYKFDILRRFSLSGIVPIAVCILTAGMIYWLFRHSPEISGIQGIAEAREFTVSSFESGRVVSVEVALGQKVAHNQVLANLDTGTLEQEIKVAEAELRELESQVPAHGKSLEMNGLESSRAFKSDMEKAAEELENARAACQRIRAEIAGTQQEFNRQKDLVQRHLASAERLNELQVQLTVLQQERDSCPLQIKTLEAKNRAARQRFDEWRISLEGNSGQNARQEQLLPIRLQSQRQQENLRLLKMRAENMVLRSPVDGFIAHIHTASGSIAIAGAPVFVIVESSPQQVIAYLDENRLCPVAAGDGVMLRPRDKAASIMQGTVISVSPAISQLPQRFWPTPNRPLWGKQLFIRVDSSRTLVPGEKFDVIPSPKTERRNPPAVSANENNSGKPSDAPVWPKLQSNLMSRPRVVLDQGDQNPLWAHLENPQ